MNKDLWVRMFIIGLLIIIKIPIRKYFTKLRYFHRMEYYVSINTTYSKDTGKCLYLRTQENAFDAVYLKKNSKSIQHIVFQYFLKICLFIYTKLLSIINLCVMDIGGFYIYWYTPHFSIINVYFIRVFLSEKISCI